jgi:hypothetical protein
MDAVLKAEVVVVVVTTAFVEEEVTASVEPVEGSLVADYFQRIFLQTLERTSFPCWYLV